MHEPNRLPLNLKANNDVIISSVEKKVKLDIDEEKYVHYTNTADLFFSVYLFASSGYICIMSALSITKQWIIVNSDILRDHISKLAM